MQGLLSSSPTDAVSGGAPAVADIGISERLDFLRKTYGLFTLGVGTSAVGALAGLTVLSNVFMGMHPLVLFIAYIAAYFAVYAVRKVPVVNVVAMLAFTFISGLFIAPLLAHTLITKGIAVGLANIMTAFLGTTLGFGGLTAYVMISRKDFSFLGGFLAIGLFGLIGVVLASLLLPMVGMSMGSFNPATSIAFNLFGLLLFSGFVLYDTSNILHHYAQDEYVMAALALFLDFILIFKYLLRLLNSRD